MKSAREFTRRGLLRQGAALVAIGAAAVVAPGLASAQQEIGGVQHGEILELFAAFHRAKSTRDIDLMMSQWADDCFVLGPGGVPTINGKAALRTAFLTGPIWAHQRISLVTSFKDQSRVHGDSADFYMECHDVAMEAGDTAPIGAFVGHPFLAGTLRKVNGRWLFDQTHTGPAPLSVTTIYYP